MAEQGLWDKLSQTWPARAAQGLWEGLTLPGDVYQGNVSMYGEDGRTNPQVIDRANNLAGAMTLGAGAIPAEANSLRAGIKAYHGSPHDFDKFDLSKIGTGEGAQAYGHGLYFAENEGVARSYKAAGQPSYLGADRIKAAQDLFAEANGDMNLARSLADQRMKATKVYSEGKLWQDVNNNLPDLINKSPGKMYEVNINADPAHFLDWDKPLRDQAIAEKVAGLVPRDLRSPFDANVERGVSGGNVYHNYLPRESFAVRAHPGEHFSASPAMSFEDALASVGGDNSRVRTIWTPSKSATASKLNEAGIPGIKYLDQGSRSAGQGSSNYVMFNDKLIDIMRKYGLAGATPLATGLGLSGQDQQQ